MSGLTVVKFGKLGELGRYRWQHLQRKFVVLQTKEAANVVDLSNYSFGKAKRERFDCIKVLFHPFMVNFYGRIPMDGLKEFTFQNIDQVAKGLESMGASNCGVFDCIVDRMQHLIGNVGDIRKLIDQSTSSCLILSLSKQEHSLVQVKSMLLYELALDYQNKPSYITPSNQSMVDMFEHLWSIPQKTPQILNSLGVIASDVDGTASIGVLNVVAGSIKHSWQTLNFTEETVQCVGDVNGLKYLLTRERFLREVSFESQCALLTLVYYFQPTAQLETLIRKMIAGNGKNENLAYFVEAISKVQLGCKEGKLSHKIVFDMVEILVKEGESWEWYPAFLKWMYKFYQENNQKLIIDTITKHASTTDNQFDIALKITDFYYLQFQSPIPNPVLKIIHKQIPWL